MVQDSSNVVLVAVKKYQNYIVYFYMSRFKYCRNQMTRHDLH